MSQKKRQEETFLDTEVDLQKTYDRTEGFIKDNKMILSIGIGAVMLLVLLGFGFFKIYLPGQEKEAQEEMYWAQNHFAQDSFDLALNGNDSYVGFLEIIDNYSSFTDAVNLSNYYAGICNLNLGNFEEAIEYLDNFSSNDHVVSSVALGAMGDAYMELGDTGNGISYYKKAANNDDNELSAPMYMEKAGLAMEMDGDLNGAKSMIQQLLSNYPNSTQGANAKRVLARIEAKM